MMNHLIKLAMVAVIGLLFVLVFRDKPLAVLTTAGAVLCLAKSLGRAA